MQEGHKGYGDFGSFAPQYQVARKQFPEEVIAYVLSQTQSKNPRILDVACGTGIATRQLHESGALVAGTDIDKLMIAQAQLNSDYSIEYHVASAQTQPFGNGSFDAITVFSAFQWFPELEVLGEFKRVLKCGGILFVVNKRETGNFKGGFRKIVQRTIRDQIPDAKHSYKPETLLEEAGFQTVKKAIFPCSESFTKEEALAFFQTVSLWNLVPENKRSKTLCSLRNYLTQQANDRGMVDRKLEIIIVSGRNDSSWSVHFDSSTDSACPQ